MNLSKSFGKRLLVIGLLAVLAMWRAEQGGAEMRGRPGEPSRLLRLTRDPAGENWTVVVLGREAQVPARRWWDEALAQIRKALP
jgi:hypothetical protein